MTGDQKHPPKIYSMLNDFAFQWIFGRKGNEKLTISLLNAILQLEDDRRIDTLELLNPFNMRQFRNDKLTVVDVKARDFKGQWYNIEAQVHENEAYIARTVFTWRNYTPGKRGLAKIIHSCVRLPVSQFLVSTFSKVPRWCMKCLNFATVPVD